MQYKVIEQTQVLTPNLKHKNFNKTSETIGVGKVLEGKSVAIKGKRKGEDWTYYLVQIEPNKFLQIKHLQEMKEVNIGADASNSATVVKVPSNTKPLKWHLILAAGGALVAYAYAKKKGKSKNEALMIAGAGAVVGYVAGNAIYRKKMVTISNK